MQKNNALPIFMTLAFGLMITSGCESKPTLEKPLSSEAQEDPEKGENKDPIIHMDEKILLEKNVLIPTPGKRNYIKEPILIPRRICLTYRKGELFEATDEEAKEAEKLILPGYSNKIEKKVMQSEIALAANTGEILVVEYEKRQEDVPFFVPELSIRRFTKIVDAGKAKGLKNLILLENEMEDRMYVFQAEVTM